MANVYATPADYQSVTGKTPPDDITVLLADASRFLDAKVFRHAYYAANATTGLPIEPLVLEAFKLATCAQVRWWGEVGDSTGVGGVGTYDTVKVGTVSMSGSKVTGPGKTSAARMVAPAAMDALMSPYLHPYTFRLGLVVSV